jgi:hypothetical protein
VTPGVRDRVRPLMAALCALALVIAWEFLVVHFQFGGNWTVLFCTGGNLKQPPALADENIYCFPNSYGYDGQFYHYVAHDPLFRHRLTRYIDAPRLRYRRILLPGLAYLLAAGQARAIDPALIAVNLLFLFAGVYWLCRYAVDRGHHVAWGLLFLAVPAVLVSLDRLTVDLALTALCVGFVLYLSEERSRELFWILVAAALARETGILLTAAYCVRLVFERRIPRAVLFAASATPALAWYAFVQGHTRAYGTADWFTPWPLQAAVARMIHSVNYPFVPAVKWSAVVLDECAVAGMLLAFLLSFRWPRAGYPVPAMLAALLMTLTGLNLGAPFWADAFSFGRVFSPLLVLLALQTGSTRSWLPVLPVALIAPRIVLQLAYHLVKVAQALFA